MSGREDVPHIKGGDPLAPERDVCGYNLRFRWSDSHILLLPFALTIDREVRMPLPITRCIPPVDFFDESPAEPAPAYKWKATFSIESPT